MKVLTPPLLKLEGCGVGSKMFTQAFLWMEERGRSGGIAPRVPFDAVSISCSEK